jgi:UDP-glucose 4-epimerase
MKCLVTGGAGFIGSHLVELLINNGDEVIVVDNLTSGRVENLSNVISNSKFLFLNIDIRDAQSLNFAFVGVDWVFHLAGLADIVPSIESPDQYYSTNVTGTINVLECARSNRVKRLVYAASSSSYGIPDKYPTDESSPIKPLYPYALTKYMGEELVLHWSQVFNLSSVSLRLFNVYGTRARTTGSYGAVFGVFLAQKINNRALTVVGNGTQTRDFTYVTDVARAFLAAAQSAVSGEAMNVGSGNHYSVNLLVNLLGGTVQYIPKRPGEPDCTFANIDKITRLLNWHPQISFEDGVGKMLAEIENWKNAPVWNPSSIQEATQTWFKYLGNK